MSEKQIWIWNSMSNDQPKTQLKIANMVGATSSEAF